MRDALWLLKFDFKTSWKWNVMIFPILIAIVFVFLKYSPGEIDDFANRSTIGVDLFYVIGYGGLVGLFSFRENVNPKRLRFDDYYIPFIRLMLEMNVKPTEIAQFYMLKVMYSITIISIAIGCLLYPNWLGILSMTDYVYFVLFTLGISYTLGFLATAINPMRKFITLTIISIIVIVIFMFGSSFLFLVLNEDGLLGFVLAWIEKISFLVPLLSFVGAGISYFFSKGLMVKLIERRDFE